MFTVKLLVYKLLQKCTVQNAVFYSGYFRTDLARRAGVQIFLNYHPVQMYTVGSDKKDQTEKKGTEQERKLSENETNGAQSVGSNRKEENFDSQSEASETPVDNTNKIEVVVDKWAEFSSKYERYGVRPAKIIYDYDEERMRRQQGLFEIEPVTTEEEEDVVFERGITGVYDIQELTALLRQEKAEDIVTIKVPDEIMYVNYLVTASAKSQRHLNSLAETVRKIYLKKRHKSDPPLIVEGKKTNWVALDMGNIALHIMKTQVRESMDLETLWSVGHEFDQKSHHDHDDPYGLSSFISPLSEFLPSNSVTQVGDEMTKTDI